MGQTSDSPFRVFYLGVMTEKPQKWVVAASPDGERRSADPTPAGPKRNIYLLTGNDGGRLFLPHTCLRWPDRFILSVPEFEQLTARKPHNAYLAHQPFGIYVLEPWSGPGSPAGNLPRRVLLYLVAR